MEFGRSEGPRPSEAPCMSSTGPRRARCTWGQARLHPHRRPRQPAATKAQALATADLRSRGHPCSSLRHPGGNGPEATKKETSLRTGNLLHRVLVVLLVRGYVPHQTVSFRGGRQPLHHPHTTLPAQSAVAVSADKQASKAREASAAEYGGTRIPLTPVPPWCCRHASVSSRFRVATSTS